MPAQVSIGLTSSSLTALPAPTSNQRIKRSYRRTLDRKVNIDNGTLLKQTGKEKTDILLNFEFKSKTNFDTIRSYCVPQQYWVRIEDGTGNYYFDGFAYLVLDDDELLTRSPVNFPSFFSVLMIEK